MNEKYLEKLLVKHVKAEGGVALKLCCPGFDGMPDRLLLFPLGRIGFVEVKAPGMKPRPLQTARHGMLRSLSFEVHVLDCKNQIPEIINQIQGGDAK